jgi:hypothetical protein
MPPPRRGDQLSNQDQFAGLPRWASVDLRQEPASRLGVPALCPRADTVAIDQIAKQIPVDYGNLARTIGDVLRVGRPRLDALDAWHRLPTLAVVDVAIQTRSNPATRLPSSGGSR